MEWVICTDPSTCNKPHHFENGEHVAPSYVQVICDYEFLGDCELPDTRYKGLDWDGQPYECGEPAIARVWWEDYDNALLVCKEHFDYIQETEEKYREE